MSDNPLVDTIIDINAASISKLDSSIEGLLMVRLAALVAVDAPTASYLITLEAGADTMLALEDVRNVLIAVAPVVGTPKIVSAVGKIADALDIAIDLDELMSGVEGEDDES